MLAIVPTSQFKKDYKLMKKRGLDMRKLEDVIDTLASETPLEARFSDHELTGQYKGFRECHIAPDWLLIYAVNRDELILTAARTGSHSDLF